MSVRAKSERWLLGFIGCMTAAAALNFSGFDVLGIIAFGGACACYVLSLSSLFRER